MPHHPPTNSDARNLITDEGELSLYRLHSNLFALSMELGMELPEMRQRMENTLRYLEGKDPVRARLLRQSLHLAASLIEEATALVNDGMDWGTVEALYCPPETEWVDTPGHWYAVGRAAAQEQEKIAQNGHNNGHNGSGALNGTTPLNGAGNGAGPAPVAPFEMPAAEKPAVEKPTRRASAAALRSLGRSIRSDVETEKRRFYAIARDHGLPTGADAGEAMRAALSKLFEEPISSRKQLTATQWSKAASAIQTEDLIWTAPKPPTIISAQCSGPRV